MRLEPTARPAHVLRVNARLITSSTILHFTSDELERAISQEQLENPAFEVNEQRICLFCGVPLYGQKCSSCGYSGSSTQLTQSAIATNKTTHDESISEQHWNEYFYNNTLVYDRIEENETQNPLLSIPANQTLTVVLLEQLETLIQAEDAPIAEQLVGNLNERGYLEVNLEEIAELLDVPVQRVAFVLSQLHTLDPPGIGARDLRECLLLQLNALSEPELPNTLVYVLIDRYIHQLGQSQFRRIAREIKASEQEVRQAIQFIRNTLYPYPAHTYQANVRADSTLAIHIHPDIIIRKVDTGYEVELIEEQRYRLSIGSGYGTQPLSLNNEIINEDVQRYIRHYSDQAKFFIDCVHRRWQTLHRIVALLVNYQAAFLEQGVRYLRPLTRSEIAVRLHLDEGTVSRAIANKYALLPDGSLVPIADFFDGSLSIKDVIRELISLEKPGNRLSDEELAGLLTVRGIPIARRTVTKYREEMGIFSSRER